MKKTLVLLVCCTALSYLVCSFIWAKFNPWKWTSTNRFFMVIGSGMCFGTGIMGINLYRLDKV